MSEKVNL